MKLNQNHAMEKSIVDMEKIYGVSMEKDVWRILSGMIYLLIAIFQKMENDKFKHIFQIQKNQKDSINFYTS
ncbi:MAG: hypothetical protein B2I18_01945 [Cuniculiplasma sp. C_DKE]|nr:MAG: hypothetical protein B2I18_01945 [Cuniculiplasma sp. C_DKE]